jgi:hypothetical protein
MLLELAMVIASQIIDYHDSFIKAEIKYDYITL